MGKKVRLGILVLLLLVLLPLGGLFARSVAALREYERGIPKEGARIFDRHGVLILSLGGASSSVSFHALPPFLVEAIVAVEDARFFSHGGVDGIGILRAIRANLRARRVVQGASTITQQLAKNMFLHPGKTLPRKIEELCLALLLEMRYSKEQILEMYLNQIYFGEGVYGIDSAARTYFGKEPSELSKGECALLAGLPKAPSLFSPYRNEERARLRRRVVLQRMVATKVLGEEEAEILGEEPLELKRELRGQARYFTDWVISILLRELGETRVFQGGLRVHTTLDLSMQRIAEEVFKEGGHEGALVTLDPHTGEVRALVGGLDYFQSQFNRATQAKRQPGSAIKPLIYMAALQNGFAMNSLVEDIPRAYAGYEPENYQGQYWGPVTMKHALALSLNNAAVWTLQTLGIQKGINTLKSFGIPLALEDRNLALALGGLTYGVSPLLMTASYAPFANGGFYHAPIPIRRVIDHKGHAIYEAKQTAKRVATEEEAYLMTNMLQAVLTGGTARRIDFNRPAAVKTGTTNNHMDLWFIGYTPSLLTGIYLGNDDRTPVEGFGGATAGPIWAAFMNRVLASAPEGDFLVPKRIVTGILVDIFTGLLANERCEWIEEDAFLKGTEPTRFAPCALRSRSELPDMEEALELAQEPERLLGALPLLKEEEDKEEEGDEKEQRVLPLPLGEREVLEDSKEEPRGEKEEEIEEDSKPKQEEKRKETPPEMTLPLDVHFW